MGRKGVNKRKPKQNASKPQSNSNPSNTVSSALRSEETTIEKSSDTGKVMSTNHRNKNSKKD